jgi:hypothetical protein
MSVQLHVPAALPPGEKVPGTHWIGGWVGPTACLDDVEKTKFVTLPGLELRTVGRSARSQSLYRLRYPGTGLIIIPTFFYCPSDHNNNQKLIYITCANGFITGTILLHVLVRRAIIR